MKLLTVLVVLLALVGCSPAAEPIVAAPPSTAATTASARTSTAARPTSVPVSTDLPAAPPVEQWVEKASGFQQTLDLEMRTKLIELGVAPVEATDTAARDLAYLVCATLRAGVPKDQVNELVQTAYPTADGFDALGIVITAQGYCLDTF